jgi:protein-disulfide isomerase
MPLSLLRTLSATMFVIACARSDAAPRTKESTTPATPATSVASTATPAAAPGAPRAVETPAASAAPHDSTTDRADRGRILGDSAAPLWVIMASDFQCPFCKQWHDTEFQKIVNSYVKTGRVRLAYLNLPLSIHRHAIEAAEAAMCASVQNKFWQMHDALFATQHDWESLTDPSPKFESLAKATGVDMTAWGACMEKHSVLPLVQADRERVEAARVNSTPTFFVGDQVLPGADAKLAEAIDAALAKMQTGKKPTG